MQRLVSFVAVEEATKQPLYEDTDTGIVRYDNGDRVPDGVRVITSIDGKGHNKFVTVKNGRLL